MKLITKTYSRAGRSQIGSLTYLLYVFSATAMDIAVVLDYLLERGESERREGGLETPAPAAAAGGVPPC